MLRPSGTEPLIRMYAESTDKSLLDSKVDEYRRLCTVADIGMDNIFNTLLLLTQKNKMIPMGDRKIE